MGLVFHAHDPAMGRDVAIKVLRLDPALSHAEREEISRRFEGEARAAGGLNHPNIVAHYERGEIDGHRYIVMELVQGRSLGDLLRGEGRLSPERAVRLMRDICAGVGVAHRQGLLHRDLKPDNVIVVPPSHEGDEETAKVVDFGLAKVRDAAGATALTRIPCLASSTESDCVSSTTPPLEAL